MPRRVSKTIRELPERVSVPGPPEIDAVRELPGEPLVPEAPESDAIAARYWITFFVFSVFPAPDSPLMKQNG